jgi:hypothetical protein
MTGIVDDVSHQAKEAARKARPGITRLAQIGYAAKGMVYVGMGVLAVRAALGLGSANVDQETLLREIFLQPFGVLLLALIAIGLICYVIWRLAQAILNPERRDHDAGGWIERVGALFSAVGYAALALLAARLAARASTGSGSRKDGFINGLILQPWGRWLLVAAGGVVIAVGIAQFYKSLSANFVKEIKSSKLYRDGADWMIPLGRYGILARGVVYLIIGLLTVQAAMLSQPGRAGSIGEALQALQAQPFGAWLLGVVAVGLVAYGVYAMLYARYGRFYR